MKYGRIKKTDIANGTGVRVSLFVSGCRNHCKGCFNPETWDFNYGKEYTNETKKEILDALAPDYISGLSILGGEPLEPENYIDVMDLCYTVKNTYPKKTIWLYTGYNFEYFERYSPGILSFIDVMVDGKFREDLKDISLKFKGSSNQRIIDVKKSLSRHVVEVNL